jgi:hypothetical protein
VDTLEEIEWEIEFINLAHMRLVVHLMLSLGKRMIR